MRLIIDIPEDCYRYIKEIKSLIIARGTYKTIQKDVIDAIKNGTLYEERPTGGHVVPDTLQGWRYEERPTGEWNYIQAGMCVCPFCGAYPHELYKNYCPKCGARLEAENER